MKYLLCLLVLFGMVIGNDIVVSWWPDPVVRKVLSVVDGTKDSTWRVVEVEVRYEEVTTLPFTGGHMGTGNYRDDTMFMLQKQRVDGGNFPSRIRRKFGFKTVWEAVKLISCRQWME